MIKSLFFISLCVVLITLSSRCTIAFVPHGYSVKVVNKDTVTKTGTIYVKLASNKYPIHNFASFGQPMMGQSSFQNDGVMAAWTCDISFCQEHFINSEQTFFANKYFEIHHFKDSTLPVKLAFQFSMGKRLPSFKAFGPGYNGDSLFYHRDSVLVNIDDQTIVVINKDRQGRGVPR
jgi:hypothetical protein